MECGGLVQDSKIQLANVRFVPKADILGGLHDVCFTPESGHHYCNFQPWEFMHASNCC
jgi:hypothetical protein